MRVGLSPSSTSLALQPAKDHSSQRSGLVGSLYGFVTSVRVSVTPSRDKIIVIGAVVVVNSSLSAHALLQSGVSVKV